MLITILYAIWIAYTVGSLTALLGILGFGWFFNREEHRRPMEIKKSQD